jgi:hypothetical protein
MDYPVGAVEIRGCAFFPTVFREIYMQSKINRILEAQNLTGGNIPVGAWAYNEKTHGV